MFDKISIRKEQETNYVPYEKTVNINKPSTAEDLSLLDKMRKEARDNILFTETLSSNLLKDAKITLCHDIARDVIGCHFAIIINGEKISHYKELEDVSGFSIGSYDFLCGKIKEIVADTVEKNIISGLSDQIISLCRRF